MSRLREQIRRAVKGLGTYAAIVVGTLIVLDGVLLVTGLFPPPVNLGDPEVGWVSGAGTGRRESVSCVYPATGEHVTIARNERGYRTSYSEMELETTDALFKVAVTGDSHTDLCLSNEDMHFGVLERSLTAAGLEAAVFAYGAGRYSPLQAYMVLREGLERIDPAALVLNLYTGNDFYDMLRVDDRPHFVRANGRYAIAPPVWYTYDPPGTVRRSRVLFALGKVAERVGVRDLFTRLRYLTRAAREQGSGVLSVVSYMHDLSRSTSPDIGYPAGFSAQILNQQLFFHHFTNGRDESVRRVRALMELIRRENPDVLLVMSPIPSYQLVGEKPVDPAFTHVLERLPVGYEEGRAMEEGLYEAVRAAAAETGWLFVDNLSELRAYEGPGRLYDDFDYHVSITANEIIGRAQARAVLDTMGRQ